MRVSILSCRWVVTHQLGMYVLVPVEVAVPWRLEVYILVVKEGLVDWRLEV